jgi:Caspase domain
LGDAFSYPEGRIIAAGVAIAHHGIGSSMRFVRAILTICLSGLFSQSALAEKRVALVIGNSDYRNVGHLANPANDAQLVADTLKTGGFDTVVFLRDINTSEMRRRLRAFGDQVRHADVAVVFYAGHGIEVDGINYLIPIDAALERDIDVYDEAFSLDRVLVTIEPAKRLRLVILDACRDNPFTKTMKRTVATRAAGRGLTRVEPMGPNTLIAFAAKAGSTASDGDDTGSPFTAALVKHIATPGLDLRKAFGYVRDDVLKATSNRQEPYVYGSLGGDDVPLVAASQAPPGPQPSPQSEIRRDFELALQTGGREAFEAFLRAYPAGFYADLATVQLRKIAAEEARAAAEEKARLAAQESERLAAEGAKTAEQAKAAVKAAADAKAAEAARLAAEKAKQVETEKAAAAERARAAAEQAAAKGAVE